MAFTAVTETEPLIVNGIWFISLILKFRVTFQIESDIINSHTGAFSCVVGFLRRRRVTSGE